MGIKRIMKSVTPSPLWEYLRHKREGYKLLSSLRSYRRSTSLTSFLVLDDEQKSGGKIFCGTQYYSQACQDYVLDRFIFARKEGGFFLDIGGNDPVSINNTYFFEKVRGWTGIAFEPVAREREKWKASRKTECLPYALGSIDGEADFCEFEASAGSGFSGTAHSESSRIKSVHKVPVRRLSGILEERGIKHVDFVSLDVEGAEIEVLRGIDFSRADIGCFTIENNKGQSKEKAIRDFMTDAGYKLKARLDLDEVWVKA